MTYVKYITQRVSIFIIAFLALYAIPWGLAQLGLLVGYWQFLDSFYPKHPWIFFAAFIMTRLLFGSMCIVISVFIAELVSMTGYLWFPRRKPQEKQEATEEYKDQSFIIFFVVWVAVVLIMLSEVAIRLYTGLPGLGL